jgi:hypothetical protein
LFQLFLKNHKLGLFGEAGGTKILRRRWQFGFHFSPAWVETMIAAIETDDTAMRAKGQSSKIYIRHLSLFLVISRVY